MRINKFVFNFSALFFFCTSLFSQVPPAQKFNPTPADQVFARELQQKAKDYIKANKPPYPQSLVHLATDDYANNIRKTTGNTQFVDKTFGLAEHQALINAALKQEIDHANYYVVYTAIPTFHMFQDIVLKMYEATRGKIGALKTDAFQFVRYQYDNPEFNTISNTALFMRDQINKYGIINDRQLEVKKLLLSTNLALFGNIGFTGESTWYFFNEPQPWALQQSWKDFKRTTLIESLNSFGYSGKFADELLTVENLLADAQGYLPSDLIQIFIPAPTNQLNPKPEEAKFVNKIGYISWRLGLPFDLDLLPRLFNMPKMTFGVNDGMIFDLSQTGGIKQPGRTYVLPTVENFIEAFKKGELSALALSRDFAKKAADNWYSLNAMLRRYKNNPDALLHKNWLQGRILITNEVLLNPESGVLIYRYYPIAPATKQEYEAALDAIFVQMEQDRVASKKIVPVTDTDLEGSLKNLTVKLKNLTSAF
ncbi:MAG TPA: hypothetical protein VHO47_02270 [Candidatus Babeliales bacterium]|nr:hypothetical protein [Candidatus Babeliales bacterium]